MSGESETGLILPVPEAEPLVRRWRERYDDAARTGVPAHITLLYPFLPPERIGDAEVRRLGELFAGAAPMRFELAAVRRFEGIVYLAPVPDTPMRDLTMRIWELYPETPPYGGAYPQVVPHLTVAQVDETAVLDEVEASLAPGLPITSLASDVWLIVHGAEERWQVSHRFRLGG